MDYNKTENDDDLKHHHSHHHHHKSHTPDASEIFKRNSFMSMKRRKKMGKILYVVMIITAILVIGACILATITPPR